MACPLHEAVSRAERRRLERELAVVRPAPGVGGGWRLTARGRRYSVREPGPVDLDRLLAESDAAAARLGCTCLASMEVAA
jgi:hypothetical protein